jgi:hypothetical protein
VRDKIKGLEKYGLDHEGQMIDPFSKIMRGCRNSVLGVHSYSRQHLTKFWLHYWNNHFCDNVDFFLLEKRSEPVKSKFLTENWLPSTMYYMRRIPYFKFDVQIIFCPDRKTSKKKTHVKLSEMHKLSCLTSADVIVLNVWLV